MLLISGLTGANLVAHSARHAVAQRRLGEGGGGPWRLASARADRGHRAQAKLRRARPFSVLAVLANVPLAVGVMCASLVVHTVRFAVAQRRLSEDGGGPWRLASA